MALDTRTTFLTDGIIGTQGHLSSGRIETDLGPDHLLVEVMKGNIVIIKNVFERRLACALRDAVFEWEASSSPSNQNEFLLSYPPQSFRREKGISKLQKTLHYYFSYNFNDFTSGLPLGLTEPLSYFYLPLRDFYNLMTGNRADFFAEGPGQFLHPQIIRYPSGGGFFAKHFHPLNPQKIGLIVAFSSRGEGFHQGGAGFEVNNAIIEIESHHHLGDIALFRYDLAHWVTPVDIELPISAHSPQGRWSLVCPYY